MDEAGKVAFRGGENSAGVCFLCPSRRKIGQIWLYTDYSTAAHHGEWRPKEPRDDGEAASRAPMSRGRTAAATETELKTDDDDYDDKS
ncbi:hypothetical protein Bca4012_062806 [Brassica carinata]|uniref:Uncharacterized protein n=1 Tax=Brassica carinata TaxID=52824 RepID=A0A8X7V573_BRACI|nr:hypothetical protein Bca52824_032491 [Brassica carinata]